MSNRRKGKSHSAPAQCGAAVSHAFHEGHGNMENVCGISANCWKEIPKYRLSLSDLSLGAVRVFLLLLPYFQNFLTMNMLFLNGGENLTIKGQTVESFMLVMHSQAYAG